MKKVVPVILAGGSGKRLWPLSKKNFPKQFLKLNSTKTLLQETILRTANFTEVLVTDPVIMSNYDNRFIVSNQTKELDINSNIIIEPQSKNTAPAISAAAYWVDKHYPGSFMLVMSADHAITETKLFEQSIKLAINSNISNRIVIFGIKPSNPSTHYGYIKVSSNNDDEYFNVDSFVEKPNSNLAEEFFKDKSYYWNSGIFLFETDTFINEIKKFEPSLFTHASESTKKAKKDWEFIKLDESSYTKCNDISIDYALIEKTKKVIAFKLASDWSDIGTWPSLVNHLNKKNIPMVVPDNSYLFDCNNCFTYSADKAIVGNHLENLLIINTDNTIFISDQRRIDSINEITANLREISDNFVDSSNKCYRPWGSFELLRTEVGFQVKKLSILPQCKLSVQKHFKRSEHWVVVSGVANVQVGDKFSRVKKGESIFIPKGSIHSLQNGQKVPLEIIEVQIGSYLGEDDIVRLSDKYGRS